MVFSLMDTISEKVEIAFNIVDALPGPNLVSGPLRITCGKVQVFAGAISFVVHYGASLFAQDGVKERMLEARALKSLEIACHGLLNVIRGIAATCFMGLFLLLFYDIPGWHILEYRDINYYFSVIPA